MALKLDAQWTDDCCGKKDFDGDILSISTRYWPAGGGYMVLMNGPDGKIFTESAAIDKSLPHAKSELILRHAKGEAIVLTEIDIEGSSFEEVAQKVEVWAKAEFEKLVRMLRQHYVFKNAFGGEG